ncbi:MAG: hypothetical protein PSX81_08170 [bacterium]|nr:hypothetical protein [bacterium]
MKLLCLLTITILFLSCNHQIKYISYAYNYIADYKWAAAYKGNHYNLKLIRKPVRGENIWFDGLLTRNDNDTFLIHGFVKGNHYVSWYTSIFDTIENNHVDIWYYKDSITLYDRNKKVVDSKISLYKVKE